MGAQATLLGWGEPSFDACLRGVRRVELGRGAWLEHRPGWLDGHAEVFRVLRQTTDWHAKRRVMYERLVDVPRLTASLPDDGPGHPVLPALAEALSRHYQRDLCRISFALYRDGHDSVAWHGDRMGALRDDTVVAIVSLGGPRRFLVRPAGGGPSRSFSLGWGDLLAMGGTAQRTFEHCVPKCAHADPRISVMFREAVPEPAPPAPGFRDTSRGPY